MSNAFARAHMMMAAIAAAMALGGSAQREALAGIGPYVSRGKGRGKGAKWTGGSARSKYMPHIGLKEQARAKRCYMSFYLNESVAQFHPRDGHMRVSPTLCQIGKATHAAYLEAREQEYESAF
ncbi:hypothetical protein [Paraburkholderia sediminicola]|uniref:hypothetical protein n=1 Tax=Paraburkholderia sediminicola TaxID=458836 RepID=UPI0038B7C118